MFIIKRLGSISLILFALFFVVDNTSIDDSFKLNILTNKIDNNDEIENINSDEHLLYLEIPSIEIYQVVYDIDNEQNSIKYHVEILKNSNIEKNFYLFAAHSGNSSVSYFNNLVNLSIGDVIFVKFDNNSLCYLVDNIYYIEKLGYLNIEGNERNVLFLITCSLEYPGKQLIVHSSMC